MTLREVETLTCLSFSKLGPVASETCAGARGGAHLRRCRWCQGSRSLSQCPGVQHNVSVCALNGTISSAHTYPICQQRLLLQVRWRNGAP